MIPFEFLMNALCLFTYITTYLTREVVVLSYL